MPLGKKPGVAIIVLCFVALALSQNPAVPTFPTMDDRLPYVTGQVVISDGTKLGESVPVQIVCSNRVLSEIYTDVEGNFSFDPAKIADAPEPHPADVDPLSKKLLDRRLLWDDCIVRSALAGFVSGTLEFSRFLDDLGVVDIGKIRLQPVNPGAKTSVSVSSLQAPKSARKAMDKGLRLEKENKWPQAGQAFKQAVQLYPQYAAAWSELGRVQYIQKDFSSAHTSFQHASEIDPKYIRPYLGLAQLALDAHNWPELVQKSEKVLALDSASYPAMWLLNATGHYNLHEYDAAEFSIRSGKQTDPQHRIREFHSLWMRIVSERQPASSGFAEPSPPVRLRMRSLVPGDRPDRIWRP